MLTNSIIVNLYQNYLMDNAAIKSIGPQFKVVALPFLNQDNDFIEILIRRTDDGYIFTDGGDTLDRLILAGVNITKPGNEGLINEIVNRYGVGRKGNIIGLGLRNNLIDRGPNLVPATINTIVQCILAIEAAFYYTRIPGQPLPGSKK